MKRIGDGIAELLALRALEASYAHVSSRRIIDILADFVRPERLARFEEVASQRLGSVTVLFDAPYDPHNGAAVLRTSDCFGVAEIHVVERRVPFLASQNVSRGSQKWVDVKAYSQVGPAIAALRGAGFTLVATHPEGQLVPPDLASVEKLCLVLGNERDGITEELEAACERTVRVPMRGFAESLNVSVTAAILLEQATRDRQGDLPAERRERLVARGLLSSIRHAAEVLASNGIEKR